MEIQYLGQEGFRFQDGARAVVVDPYLSYSVDRLTGFPPGFWKRNYPPPVAAAALVDTELVLCTHDHLDHADPESLLGIARASPGAIFAGPRATVGLMQQIGIPAERTLVLNARRESNWRGVTIEPVAAAHEDYEIDADGFHRFLGYLIHWADAVFYHAGDTVVAPGLVAHLEQRRVDIAFLPVNGGDDARRRLGIVGNMDVAGAADLAARCRFRTVVPMHYDLYPNNGLTNEEFESAWSRQPEAAKIELLRFTPGETTHWPIA